MKTGSSYLRIEISALLDRLKSEENTIGFFIINTRSQQRIKEHFKIKIKRALSEIIRVL